MVQPGGILMPRDFRQAPFPWFGSKRRLAPEINARLGSTWRYVEPFAGSLSVLLARNPSQVEIVSDLDDGIVNFWRAVSDAPDEVAAHADQPVFHTDLTARHRWLVDWARRTGDRLQDDPDYYDAKAAGWWVWGICSWIGGGWCVRGGDTRPFLGGSTGHPYGMMGVDQQSVRAWFRVLRDRLRNVYVLRRPWDKCLTPAVNGDMVPQEGRKSGAEKGIAVFLDPPYLTENRSSIYGSDEVSEADKAARDSYDWAVSNGDRLRVAYCCHAGDFPVPPGWEALDWTFNGPAAGGGKRDQVLFSPACVSRQEALF